MKKLIACLLGVWVLGSAQAQLTIRQDDHFWRKRVVNRLDLQEKINRPLVEHASVYYRDGDRSFDHTDGLVAALIDGLQQGHYSAYDPDDWDKTLGYEEVANRAREWNRDATYAFPGEDMAGFESFEPATSEDTDLFEASDETDDFGSVYFDDDRVIDPYWETGMNPDEEEGEKTEATNFDLMPYEEVIHIVEDWVFDKNRSMMVQQIDFFEVIWVDPNGVLPEKILARFLWEDVEPVLDETMWHARFNDATSHSISDAITLRLFHSYPISIGGHPIRSLEEADRRYQEMIEFEAYLWSN